MASPRLRRPRPPRGTTPGKPRSKNCGLHAVYHAALTCSDPLLPASCMVEVKLVCASFWREYEKFLYRDDSLDGEARGSHNQIFSSYCRCLGGSGQTANRTENMNLFADLLGFYDDDPEKPQHSLGRHIWAAHFGHLFPPRLRVCYGAGKEFRADKEWSRKMEANLAEALIGALHFAGLRDHARAAVVLCFLASLVRPDGVLPSNWDMAEKVNSMMPGDTLGAAYDDRTFVLGHLDLDALRRFMDSLLLE
mmetsp:Transcript_156924/g.481346  ORF Transcript_156924/g.481346 Transcript_156924/m.481346 type:complete len:250 (-) Transcript_156924:118-867(-)